MITFYEEVAGGAQFNRTLTFTSVPADPSAMLVVYWLSYFSASSTDVLQIFWQHPDTDAQHRLVWLDDAAQSVTRSSFTLACGDGGRIAPRAALGFTASAFQPTNGLPWQLRVVTTGKTGDAFLDMGFAWRRVA